MLMQYYKILTLRMLRLLSSNAPKSKNGMKVILTLSCWCSFESSRRVLSDEYPFARVSVILSFSHHLVFAKLVTSSIRVNYISSHKHTAVPSIHNDMCSG